MQRLLLPLLLLSLLPLEAPALSEQEAVEKGWEIAREADRRDSGWDDFTADMKMILRDAQGDESVREIRSRTLEVRDAGDKSLTIFDHPRDVAGTAFLSHTHIKEPDDQWLYLPALKRVKRISSANKSGPFMGSEFAYEDMSSPELKKYTYKYLRDEPCGDGLECFVVERRPVYEKSGYTRQIVWFDKEHYRPMKIEYYDRKNALLKTLTLRDYNQYLGQYWRADKMTMVNHQTGKSTTLAMSNYRFRTGLDDRDFDRNSLKRAR